MAHITYVPFILARANSIKKRRHAAKLNAFAVERLSIGRLTKCPSRQRVILHLRLSPLLIR